MRRVFVVLLSSSLLLSLSAVALIAWWTRDVPPEIGRQPVASAAPWPFEVPGAAGSGEAPAPPEDAMALPEDDPATRSEAGRVRTTPAARRRALVAFRREMKAGFGALQRKVAECQVPQAAFTLDVETFEGGLRVVGVTSSSSAEDANVACARSVLMGETIAAPSAEPGRRWQMYFAAGRQVQPRFAGRSELEL